MDSARAQRTCILFAEPKCRPLSKLIRQTSSASSNRHVSRATNSKKSHQSVIHLTVRAGEAYTCLVVLNLWRRPWSISSSSSFETIPRCLKVSRELSAGHKEPPPPVSWHCPWWELGRRLTFFEIPTSSEDQ